MKKRVLITSLILFCVVFGIFALTDNDANSNNAPSPKINKVDKEKNIAKKNLKNHLVSFNKVSFKYSKIEKLTTYTYGTDPIDCIFLVGKFSNKSSKPIKPEDFFEDHLSIYSLLSKAQTELDPGSYESSAQYSSLLQTSGKQILPGKSVSCAIAYQPTSGTKVSQKCKLIVTTSNNKKLFSQILNVKSETININ